MSYNYNYNYSNYNPYQQAPIYYYYLPNGTPYTLNPDGTATYYFSDGTPYLLDARGTPFYYDQNRAVFYYHIDKFGNHFAYYQEMNGSKYYYDEIGNLQYFRFDEYGNMIATAPHNRIESIAEITPVIPKKEKLTNEELFNLFNIENKNPNIVMPFLSDHLIIRVHVKEAGGKYLKIASWNLLSRGTISHNKLYNNPWKKIETNFQFENRFKTQLSKILDIIKSIDLSVFFLQEAFLFYSTGDKCVNQFLSDLSKLNWSIIRQDPKYPLKNVILFNKERLDPIGNPLCDFVSGLKKRSILHMFFKDKKTDKTIAFGNCHFSPAMSNRKVLHYMIKRRDKVLIPRGDLLEIFGGDTNIDKPLNLFIGNPKYPTYLNSQGLVYRIDKFFFSIPKDSRLKVKEMPICYFMNDHRFKLEKKIELSNTVIHDNLDTFYYEREDVCRNIASSKNEEMIKNFNEYLKKISQKIDFSFGPPWKSYFISVPEHREYALWIYGEDKYNQYVNSLKSRNCSNHSFIGHYDTEKKSSYIRITQDEICDFLKLFMDPDYYSFFGNGGDYYSIAPKKDLFEKFVPQPKSKKLKKQILL